MHYERIILDMESQRDFFSPGGSCFTPDNLSAGHNIRRLFKWARRRGIPVLSTMLRLRPGSRGPMAEAPHCIEGTNGAKRISRTLLNRYIDFGVRASTDLPGDIFEQFQQVIVEKRCTNIFDHPRLERLVTELSAETFIMCGAGSAQGIVQAVVGLRHRKFEIVLAADAIVDLDDPDAEMAWMRMLAKGAVPLAVDEIIAPERSPGPLLRRYHRRGYRFRDGAMTTESP